MLILVFGWWERQKAMADIRGLFDSHVQSIAALIDEATREATAATALMYELSEEHLLTAAHLVAVQQKYSGQKTDELLQDESWKVHLFINKDDTATGEWGPLREDERSDFIKLMRENPEMLLEEGVLIQHHILCYSHAVAEGSAVVCRDAASLETLQSDTGLSTLLKHVIQHDIVYVALQDADGILAAAPPACQLSLWQNDPTLESSLSQSDKRMITRFLHSGRPVFEGLKPFLLPDGSQALLRIGVNGAALTHLEENSLKRFSLMAALIAGFVILLFILVVMLHIWRKRQKNAEQMLAVREEERKHWEMIGQMAATVAHEVRNPLNTLGMISQRLGREFELPEHQQQEFGMMISLMQSESERVNRVVTDFLELGKPLKVNLEPVDAGELISEALLPLRLRAENEKKILKYENLCRGEVFIDRKLFGQICANVIGNSLDALPSGGVVTVKGLCDDNGFVLTVTDNGPGIPADQVESVIKPFVSFKSSGTGLGLPLVKRYTEAMGGLFSLSSTAGQGTRVVITFPAGKKQTGTDS